MPAQQKLTYLQKIALKGEIATALAGCVHNTDVKYKSYLILEQVERKFRPAIMECLKELITFDEIELDRIYLEVQNRVTPVWLWVEEAVEDIKLSLSAPDMAARFIRTDVNNEKGRKSIVESAFILFSREALMINPSAAEQLFNKILDDYDLEFLHQACFYLKSSCPEMKEFKKGTNKPEKLMLLTFSTKCIMNFFTEVNSMSIINELENKKETETVEDTPKVIIQGDVTISGDMSTGEFSDYIGQRIMDLFGDITKKSNLNKNVQASNNTVYVVKKVFTNSGLSTDIRTCKTEDEALDFIQNIKKEYPELTSTCEFQIHMERVNGKNKWSQKKS